MNSNPIKTDVAMMVENPKTPNEIVNMEKTLSMVCPAIMLANNRMERLTGRERNEMISITISKGAIKIGAPGGMK
jgi:hypothetical protein